MATNPLTQAEAEGIRDKFVAWLAHTYGQPTNNLLTVGTATLRWGMDSGRRNGPDIWGVKLFSGSGRRAGKKYASLKGLQKAVMELLTVNMASMRNAEQNMFAQARKQFLIGWCAHRTGRRVKKGEGYSGGLQVTVRVKGAEKRQYLSLAGYSEKHDALVMTLRCASGEEKLVTVDTLEAILTTVELFDKKVLF